MKDLMKRIWKPGFGLLLLAAPVWVACDDDDDKDNGLWGDANITQAATTRYPGAQITEIERTPQGYEIQIWVNGSEAEMYIDGNYQWLYTEFEDMSMIHYCNIDMSPVSPDITPTENTLYDCNGNWIDPAIFTEDEIENIILEIAESLAEQTICTVERRSEIGNATVHDN